MVEAAPKVKLVLDDGTTIEVDKDVAAKSVLVQNAIEEDPEAEDGWTIAIKETSKETIESVVAFLTHIKDGAEEVKIESPLTKRLQEILAGQYQWYWDYVNALSDDNLLALLSAANHMDINSLMRLCAAQAADKVQQMDLPTCRAFFGFQNEYSPEEEAKMLQEHTWPFPKQ